MCAQTYADCLLTVANPGSVCKYLLGLRYQRAVLSIRPLCSIFITLCACHSYE